jgi:PIN domain nuclease of toxin-antitoxin system
MTAPRARGAATGRVLLDTHAFLWWLDGDPRLQAVAKSVIEKGAARIFVSAASAWEISTKFRLGKLSLAQRVAADVMACIRSQGFVPLPVTVDHGQRAGALPGSHKDPFDRMLIAQAQAERLAIISNEVAFDSYGVTRIW